MRLGVKRRQQQEEEIEAETAGDVECGAGVEVKGRLEHCTRRKEH